VDISDPRPSFFEMMFKPRRRNGSRSGDRPGHIRRPRYVLRVSAAGEDRIPVVVPGNTVEEIEANFLAMLAQHEWLTTDYRNLGRDVRLTFRTAFLTGYTIEREWS